MDPLYLVVSDGHKAVIALTRGEATYCGKTAEAYADEMIERLNGVKAALAQGDVAKANALYDERYTLGLGPRLDRLVELYETGEAVL